MNLNHQMNLNKNLQTTKSKEERIDFYMRKKNQNRMSRILELPQEVYSNIHKLSITGFENNNRKILKEFQNIEEFFVRIRTYIGVVNINGYNLNLENMTNDDIKVKGKIESIDIERTIEEN